MAFTSHGHQISGTVAEPRPIGLRAARCGGPAMCGTCSVEAADAQKSMPASAPREAKAYLLLPETLDVISEHTGIDRSVLEAWLQYDQSFNLQSKIIVVEVEKFPEREI